MRAALTATRGAYTTSGAGYMTCRIWRSRRDLLSLCARAGIGRAGRGFADELNGGIALFRRGIHVLRGVERRYMDC